jgi:hypothetical protein
MTHVMKEHIVNLTDEVRAELESLVRSRFGGHHT